MGKETGEKKIPDGIIVSRRIKMKGNDKNKG
jgi:hypothetical protein